MRTRIYAAVLCAGALLLADCRGRQQEEAPAPNREFAVDPPLVESSSVRLLQRPHDGANAVLTVRFAADRRLGRTVTITPDSTRVLLRDDGSDPDSVAGDRNFAGFVRVDPRELAAFRQHLAEGARRGAIPVFRGRQLVGRTALEEVAITDTTRLTLQTARIRFPGFFFLVNANRSLMVRDPAVLNDPVRTFNPCTSAGNPNGKWTFNYLMTQMANQAATGVTPATFVRQWLHQWEVPQTVNGFTIPPRAPGIQAQIINPWPKLANGDLDLTRSPFRLIAIVNRVDLRTNSVYGGGNAGEGRFVFEAMNAQCQPLRFTVILEYGVPKRFCPDVRAYAKEWYDLGPLAPGSPAYETKLEHITDQFSAANAAPGKPNGSALNQLRTNEIALAAPWELREFNISGASHLQVAATVKQTPDFPINNTQKLADYINMNAPGILANSYTVPPSFQAAPFLGAASPVPNPGTFWDGPGAHPSAQITTANTRFGFSLNTCSGCHAGETSTFFQHVSSVIPGGISGFLTGETVTDPAGEQTGGSPTQRTFNDLQRRAADLDALVHTPCIGHLGFIPLRMVH